MYTVHSHINRFSLQNEIFSSHCICLAWQPSLRAYTYKAVSHIRAVSTILWCLGCQVKPEKIFETLTFFCPGDIRKGAVTQRGPEADSQTVMNAKRAVCVFYVCECDYVILKQVQWLRIGAASFSVSYVRFSHILAPDFGNHLLGSSSPSCWGRFRYEGGD